MLYISIESKRNLLSFKDVHRNYYFIETINESNMKYLSTLLILFLAKSLLVKSSYLSPLGCIIQL